MGNAIEKRTGNSTQNPTEGHYQQQKAVNTDKKNNCQETQKGKK